MTYNEIAATAFAALFMPSAGAFVISTIRADERRARERRAELPPVLTTRGEIPPGPMPTGFLVCDRVLSEAEAADLKRRWLAAQNQADEVHGDG